MRNAHHTNGAESMTAYAILVTFDRYVDSLDMWASGQTVSHVNQAHAERWLADVARGGLELRNVVVTHLNPEAA